MSAFPDWEKFIVRQKRPATGCIPTAYEMLLRAACTQGVDYSTFQDDFDLDKNRQLGEPPRNHFKSISDAVASRYPTIHFDFKDFPKGHGLAKLRFVEASIEAGRPVIVSIPLIILGMVDPGWHIMPLVDSSSDSFTLLKGVDDKGNPVTHVISKDRFVEAHEKFDGGSEVSFFSPS